MKAVEVRNIKIGEGIPKICVPIVGVTKEDIINEAKTFENIPVDVVEWRVDWFENVFDIEKVKDFKDVFIANRNFEHLKNHPLNFEELLQYPILMLDKSSMTSEFLHNICQQRQLDLVPEVELSSNDLLIDLARIGLGIAFIPDFCLPDNDPDLFKLTMSEVFPSRQLVVGYNDKLPISEAAKYFIESLNEDK